MPCPPDPEATLADTIAAGYTHVEVRCRAPKAAGGHCGAVTAVPFAMLPARLTALRYPLTVFQDRMRCRACGARGWVTLKAWRQHEGLPKPYVARDAPECRTD